MTPDEKLDKMIELATLAMQTETGRRLFSATTTDALVTRIIGAENPDYKTIVKGMTGQALVEAGNRELDTLDDTEREQLMETVLDHLQRRFVGAVKHAWVVATALDADPTTLAPETIAFYAAMLTIPADAEHPPDS
jgi:hypothetical protein